MADSINPISAAVRVWRALQRTAPPKPSGDGTAYHDGFRPVLEAVRDGGIGAIPAGRLDSYLAMLGAIDPDGLTRDHALAYWLNLYNAHALAVAGRAERANASSVLRLKGAFDNTTITVAGAPISLDGIEHGKLRRLGDPRVHAALVCGAISCPTLRFEPFDGDKIDDQLDDQIRSFLVNGGAEMDGNTLRLSRVFLWFSGDFVRKMPAWRPAAKSDLLQALRQWLPDNAQTAQRVEFMRYDWGLACTVR